MAFYCASACLLFFFVYFEDVFLFWRMFAYSYKLRGESCRGFKLNDVKYDWWSKNVSIRIPGEDFRDISETLQKKLSIRVHRSICWEHRSSC